MALEEDDRERQAFFQQIVDMLVAAGYFRARIPSLSPFDKLTGGIAWCIAASNVDVEYEDLDYDDNATLGEKIQIGESIELALQRMECPHPLQAHQIQGLDYPSVLPVVHWLVKRVLATREELGERIRNYSHFRLSKGRDEPTPSSETQAASAAKQRVDSFIREIELHEARLSAINTKSVLLEKKQRIDEQIKRNMFLESETLNLQTSVDGDPSALKTVIEKLTAAKLIDKERALFLETSKRKLEQMEHSKRALVLAAKEGIKEPEALVHESARLKAELGRVTRAVTLLRRRLDDLPAQSELIQYEHCFMELYVNIQAKLRETRKYFASYNALAEAHELCLKEISLLNSINSQFELAMSSPGGREKLVESMEGLAQSVQQKLTKMEFRHEEKKRAYNLLQEKHANSLAARRQYFNLLRQLQEEFSKNEELQQAN